MNTSWAMVLPQRRVAAATAALHRIVRHQHPRHAHKRHSYHAAATILCSANHDNARDTGRNNIYPPHAASAEERGDPRTDDGTIVGVWLYHRHGDRAPNRYLGSPARRQEESRYWAGRIPPSPTGGGGGETGVDVLHRLTESFPPVIHASQNGGRHAGADRAPFGMLTYRGMAQMRRAGRTALWRYGASWDVKAYSTNYLRTVLSAQCFLDGLVGSGGPTSGSSEDRIKVQVRDKEFDTLNAFDRHPEMMDDLVKRVISSEHFQRLDGAAKPLADALAARLPGLHGVPQAFGGTPSGINWIHANDHFVCRRSHGVPLLAYPEDGGGTREDDAAREAGEGALAALANPVCAHLAWRFREWYRCPTLLAAMAGPPFREVWEGMVAATKLTGGGGRRQNKRPFVVSSCHDVTLLALLYAVGAEFLVAGEDCGGATMLSENQAADGYTSYEDDARYVCSKNLDKKQPEQTSWRWWPAYASTIAFELVQLDGNGDSRSAAASAGNGDKQYVIRVMLNGKALRLIPRMSAEDDGSVKALSSRKVFGKINEGGKRHCMMSVSNFEQLICMLEDAGSLSSANIDEANNDAGGITGG